MDESAQPDGHRALKWGARRRRTLRIGDALLLLSLAAASSAPQATSQCEGISGAVGEQLTSVLVVDNLIDPVLVTAPPGDTGRLFIVEQDAKIRIFKPGTGLVSPPFLDIGAIVLSPVDGGGNEEGLLGLAFHPNYDQNGWFFVYYTDLSSNNVVARFTVSSMGSDSADVSTREDVMTIIHPGRTNHNGGMIAFGPSDGYLYIGTGDGGGGCDPGNNAQDLTSRLGKILRIDVDSLPFTIPPDNPFIDVPFGAQESIWALGLRNPWRWSFDRATGDVYIGDVGQNAWEEIDYQPGTSAGGENYGWDLYEGLVCPNPSCGTIPSCSSISPVLPVAVYENLSFSQNCAVTGGYVYRGCRIPDLRGTYFYADFCTAFIKSFRIVGGQATTSVDRTTQLDPPGPLTIDTITSFGEDASGEIYVVDRGGEIFKILPALPGLEVSGTGAPAFLPGTADWVWEDLQATSSHPISGYRVHRLEGAGSGPFDCVFKGPTPIWPGGDPQTPLMGQLFSYLVVADNPTGDQTSPGAGTDGTPRTLSAAACP